MQEAFHSTDLDDWERAIIADFPLIYRETDPRCKEDYRCKKPDAAFDDANPPEDYCNLRYGFECQPGWEKIIREFSKVATDTVLAARQTMPEAFIHGSVFKEKMGKLCWQGRVHLPEPMQTLFQDYAWHLAYRSTGTCELTGAYGQPHESETGWIKTLSSAEGKKAGMRTVLPDTSTWSRTQPATPGWYWFYKPGKKSKPHKNIGVMWVGPEELDPLIIFGPECRTPDIEMLKILVNQPRSERLAP